jgi:histidyl-tRNA synthetase
MARPTALSGFPEWLPADQIVQQRVIETIRRIYELNGFAALATRSVEPRSHLAGDADTNKEIYLLRRLGAENDEDVDPDRQLGLHFDLTVPLARYVVENAGKLTFPYRRYQIQPAWRGERPQEGRFREFVQADIDVVGDGDLPFHYDIEMPLVVGEALGALPIPPVRIHANNRKLAEGFYRGLELTDIPSVLREVDKLDRVGPDGVLRALVDYAGATKAQAKACLQLAEISSDDLSFVDQVRALGVADPMLDDGLDELARVVAGAREHTPGLLRADLRIARGLDYYTGSIYETVLTGHEDLGSIASGGRYDNLASAGERRYPGVGMSVGITRLLSRVFGARLVAASRSVPTAVLIALADEGSRPAASQLARSFRQRGIATEVAPSAAKFGKQIRYADRRGIPYVWFAGVDGEPHQVKDIRSGDQADADPDTWMLPAADASPEIRPN